MLFLKALRIKQWVKNLTIFIPIIALGNGEIKNYLTLFIVYCSFSLIVSSTYIINDLIDQESDRLHPTKRLRPVASNRISKNIWIIFSISIFCIGNLVLYFVDISSLKLTFLYTIITLLYSIKLKFIKYFDILSISFLFYIRILFGSEIFNIPISPYLLIFIIFSTIGIATGKKYSILSDQNIKNTKIKDFLKKNYSSFELKTILNFSFFCSSLIYLIWIVFEKKETVNDFQFYNLILSFLLLVFFKYNFVVQTNQNNTEEITEVMFNNKYMLTIVILFLIFSMFGTF